jgi:hypothetical protein
VKSVTGSDSSTLAVALETVGAKLSGVFGFDRVLWVEGQSDATTIRSLSGVSGNLRRDISILPVRDTGSFSRRNARKILSIYRALSQSGALLPNEVRFCSTAMGDHRANSRICAEKAKIRFTSSIEE